MVDSVFHGIYEVREGQWIDRPTFDESLTTREPVTTVNTNVKCELVTYILSVMNLSR